MERDLEAAPLIGTSVTRRQSKLVLTCFAGLVTLLIIVFFVAWLPAAKVPDSHRRHHHPAHKNSSSLPVVRRPHARACSSCTQMSKILWFLLWLFALESAMHSLLGLLSPLADLRACRAAA